MFSYHSDLVCTHNIVMFSADSLWLCLGCIIFHENGGCLSLNSTYSHLQNYSFTLKESNKFVHIVTQCNLPLTSPAAAFYLLFEQDKHVILLHLHFHKTSVSEWNLGFTKFESHSDHGIQTYVLCVTAVFIEGICQ